MLTRGQISRMPTKVKRNYDCIGREGLFLQPCSWRPKRRFCHAARLPAHLASQPWENSKDAKPCRQKVVKGCRSSPTYRRLNTRGFYKYCPEPETISEPKLYTVFPRTVYALEWFPPLNSFHTFMYNKVKFKKEKLPRQLFTEIH